MVNSIDCLSPSPFRSRRLYVAISNRRAPEGKRVRAYHGGVRRRFSRPADGGGNQGNPTHGACTGRAIGKRGGFHNRRRQDQAPRPAFPFPRPATRGGWLLVGALSRFGRECTDHTRGGTLSLSLSLCHSPSSPPSPELSFSPYPSNSMCLFVYSRVLGNTRYASNGVSYTRRTALRRARPLAFPFWNCIRSVLGFLRDFEKRPIGGTRLRFRDSSPRLTLPFPFGYLCRRLSTFRSGKAFE